MTTIVGQVHGGVVADRTTLQSLLGGPGTLEDFEAYSIAAGNATGLNSVTLNSASILNGQGPGLVIPGVTFSAPGSGMLQWDAAGYFGSPSQEILVGSPAGQPLDIDFATAIQAFGIDLRAFSGFPATATLQIFAGDDTTLIGSISGIVLSGSGIPVFAGFEDVGGIGRISLTQSGQNWSPIIDNLEFGNLSAVPEPASLAIWGLAMAGLGAHGIRRRWRKL